MGLVSSRPPPPGAAEGPGVDTKGAPGMGGQKVLEGGALVQVGSSSFGGASGSTNERVGATKGVVVAHGETSVMGKVLEELSMYQSRFKATLRLLLEMEEVRVLEPSGCPSTLAPLPYL